MCDVIESPAREAQSEKLLPLNRLSGFSGFLALTEDSPSKRDRSLHALKSLVQRRSSNRRSLECLVAVFFFLHNSININNRP